MNLEEIIIAVVRIAGSLPVLFSPFFGGLAVIAIDLSDLFLMQSLQLGGVSNKINSKSTSFIHRQSMWKPWITAAWPSDDNNMKDQSLLWLERVWNELEPICPGVHLAQLHPHLDYHKKELDLAFKEWLPGLKRLKAKYDPQGVFPPL